MEGPEGLSGLISSKTGDFSNSRKSQRGRGAAGRCDARVCSVGTWGSCGWPGVGG